MANMAGMMMGSQAPMGVAGPFIKPKGGKPFPKKAAPSRKRAPVVDADAIMAAPAGRNKMMVR